MKRFTTIILAAMFGLSGLGVILGAPELAIADPWKALIVVCGLLCMLIGVGLAILSNDYRRE